MRSACVRVATVLFGLITLVTLFASATPVLAGAQPALFWIPRQVSPGELPGGSDSYFDGLSGSVVGTAPENESAVTAAGGRSLGLGRGETLFVFLLEDAERAVFEAPARVLLRAGHEVLVATRGDVPRLTAASDRTLTGIKQPVRLDLVPRRSNPAPATPLPAPCRTADPLVREMVDQVTLESYLATWQTLDDFETRHTYEPNNLAASQWILDTFQSYGLRAGFHYYEQLGEKRNVIATLPGQVDSTQVIYICGHFDSISGTPTVCAPGADDNASGTNAVLEAARILSRYRFEYTIKFACFNGEEQGRWGSVAYAGDIAAAGENVVAVYNCDMIAYRGTDPAPPDLVIYTNSLSQQLAGILASAVTTYLPNVIEPVVIVEEMTASDHASFWTRGYRAICSIEDEAWGTDFCPWYHTCNDRIERYPVDYAVACTQANLAAVAVTAVPIFQASNAGGSLVVHDTGLTYTIDMTDPPASPVPSCSDVVNAMPLNAKRVWKVYAAFPESPGPRVKELWWGLTPSANGGGGVAIERWGVPDPSIDLELVTEGWPSTPGSGVQEIFGHTKTTRMMECYWFGGYGYGGSGGETQVFATGPHPVAGGLFIDDVIPSHIEPIVAFGSLGFGQAGTTPCPAGGELGACCAGDGSCTLIPQGECAPPAIWHDEWESCAPNPCGPSAVGTEQWGRVPEVRVVPNPSAGGVLLHVVGSRAGAIEVRVFNPEGRLVRTAWRGAKDVGVTTVVWDGRDDAGVELPSGIYFAKFAMAEGEQTVKVVLAK